MFMKSCQINVRVSIEDRDAVEAICSRLGFNGLSAPINLFLRAVARTGGLSFLPWDVRGSEPCIKPSPSIANEADGSYPGWGMEEYQHELERRIGEIVAGVLNNAAVDDNLTEIVQKHRADDSFSFTLEDIFKLEYPDIRAKGFAKNRTGLGRHLFDNHENWGLVRIAQSNTHKLASYRVEQK